MPRWKSSLAALALASVFMLEARGREGTSGAIYVRLITRRLCMTETRGPLSHTCKVPIASDNGVDWAQDGDTTTPAPSRPGFGQADEHTKDAENHGHSYVPLAQYHQHARRSPGGELNSSVDDADAHSKTLWVIYAALREGSWPTKHHVPMQMAVDSQPSPYIAWYRQ